EAWHFSREPPAMIFRRPYRDLAQQRLDIGAADALRPILFRENLAIQERDRHEVWEAVIGLFLGAHAMFAPLLTTADDVVSHREDVDIDPGHLGGCEGMSLPEFQDAFDDRLGVDLGVVALEDRAGDPFQIFPRPVDLEGARDGFHEALVTLEHL